MSADKALVFGMAGRYATALFELASEAKSLDAVAADLGRLTAMISESADLKTLVMSPLMNRDDQGRGIAAVAEAAGFNALTIKFLGVLAANRRLSAVAAVTAAYNKLLAAQRGEVTAEVASAVKLSKAEQTALAAKLKSALGRDVKIDARVDAALLGGLVVKVGSRMIDSSLKTKLDNLQVAMKGIG